MRRYRGNTGSAQDLLQLQRDASQGDSGACPPSDGEGRLRRVLTAHARRRKKTSSRHVARYSLTSVLKEPLCLVNSVPLHFELNSSSTSDLSARRGVFSRRRYGSVEMLASMDNEGTESLIRRFRVENGEQVEKDEVFQEPEVWSLSRTVRFLNMHLNKPALNSPCFQDFARSF